MIFICFMDGLFMRYAIYTQAVDLKVQSFCRESYCKGTTGKSARVCQA